MNEAIEVRVARLEENMKFLVDDTKEARAGRKTQYDAIEKLTRTVEGMGTQVNSVETKLAGQAPTIEEFITIKHKVAGAGKLGKWVWIAFGGIITFLFSSRETLLHWLTK